MAFWPLWILFSLLSANAHYSLYHTNSYQIFNHNFHCLYANLIEDGREIGARMVTNYHLIPYCQRFHPNQTQQQLLLSQSTDNILYNITFNELRKQNVTSEQLLQWSIPIDIVEKYEMNLTDVETIYRCSFPWFGDKCQYKFSDNLNRSFTDIVHATFNDYESLLYNQSGSGTCYGLIDDCNDRSWPFCLDWREICDGKIDCRNGDDEKWCDQLESHQCRENEYQCHYRGQCIPLKFVKDSRKSIDCLDGSDENDLLLSYSTLTNPDCPYISTFQCQERIARYPHSYQCGDGQYMLDYRIPSNFGLCSNNRDKEASLFLLTSFKHVSDEKCQEAFRCALYSNRTEYSGTVYSTTILIF